MALVLRYGGRDFEVHLPKAQSRVQNPFTRRKKYMYQRRIKNTALCIFEHPFGKKLGTRFKPGFS